MLKNKNNSAPTKRMQAIADVLDQDSYNWMASNHPDLLMAIETELEQGHQPADIRRYVTIHTQRIELALRCEQAARYARILLTER